MIAFVMGLIVGAAAVAFFFHHADVRRGVKEHLRDWIARDDAAEREAKLHRGAGGTEDAAAASA